MNIKCIFLAHRSFNGRESKSKLLASEHNTFDNVLRGPLTHIRASVITFLLFCCHFLLQLCIKGACLSMNALVWVNYYNILKQRWKQKCFSKSVVVVELLLRLSERRFCEKWLTHAFIHAYVYVCVSACVCRYVWQALLVVLLNNTQ